MNFKILSITLSAVFILSSYALADFENFNKARGKKIAILKAEIEALDQEWEKLEDSVSHKETLKKANPQNKSVLEEKINELEDQIAQKLEEIKKKEKELDIVKGGG